MENPTYIALSKLDAQQRTMDVIANNVANANTVGYKAERMQFSDFLVDQAGVSAPPGGRILSFAEDRATYRDQSAGSLSQTGNPLDLAIGGDGYFTLQTAAGPRLTRAGRFQLLTDGTITDASGNAVLDTSGRPVQLPEGDSRIQFAADGTINGSNGTIAKIGVVSVSDINQLFPEGNKLFRCDAPTAPLARPEVVQGAVEESNVQPISELTRMMQVEREFQFITQFVQSESDRQQSTIDKVTQVGT